MSSVKRNKNSFSFLLLWSYAEQIRVCTDLLSTQWRNTVIVNISGMVKVCVLQSDMQCHAKAVWLSSWVSHYLFNPISISLHGLPIFINATFIAFASPRPLPLHSASILVQREVTSCLDYCNSVTIHKNEFGINCKKAKGGTTRYEQGVSNKVAR